ncbi:MAG: hypothetical protein ABIL18_07040 [candidate division WOR-3 bacterium]
MGVDYYLAVPKLKTLFFFGRTRPEEVQDIYELLLKFQHEEDDFETVDVQEWTAQNLAKQRLVDVARVINFYRQFAYLIQEYRFQRGIFLGIMKEYDKEAKVISEMEADNPEYKDFQKLSLGNV